MSLKDATELANTRRKLAELERRYAAAKERPVDDPHLRSLSLESLGRLIQQMKEEIALFEIRSASRPPQ
jgi:hypothetical protein